MKNSKTLKIIKKILSTLITILLIGFVIVVCLQRFSNNKMSFFNYRMFTVITGSMKPKYNIGDVLISKNVNSTEIKVGDTISYLGTSGSFKDKVITHQVVGINKDETGKYIFKTKGLANLVEDPNVYENQVYGVVIYKSFVLSMIYKIVSTNLGFYLCIIIPLLYVIGSEMISVLLNKEAKRRESLRNN